MGGGRSVPRRVESETSVGFRHQGRYELREIQNSIFYQNGPVVSGRVCRMIYRRGPRRTTGKDAGKKAPNVNVGWPSTRAVGGRAGQRHVGAAPSAGSLTKILEDEVTASEPGVISESYQQILAVFTPDRGALRAEDVCLALGIGTEPKDTEGIRAKLKRLFNRQS